MERSFDACPKCGGHSFQIAGAAKSCLNPRCDWVKLYDSRSESLWDSGADGDVSGKEK